MQNSLSNLIRTIIILFGCLGLSLNAHAASRSDTRTNQHGLALVDGAGAPLQYTKEEMAKSPLLQPQALATNTQNIFPQAVTSDWAYAAFGSGIGLSNIVTDDSLGVTEIYLGGSTSIFGANDYFHILRYQASDASYQQTFVSPDYPTGIKRIGVANVTGSAGKEIVVGLENGQVYMYDQSTRALVGRFGVEGASLSGMYLADLDGDTVSEIIITSSSRLYVYDGGILQWELVGVGGGDVIAGQMDADPALEIATTDGNVVDAQTQTVQWNWPGGFGISLEVADIDSDGMQELIAAEDWDFVWAYDVNTGFPKWSLPIFDIGAIKVTDVDADGVFELLVGEGQWGDILAYDTTTLALEWSANNPEHGVTDIAVADADQDGALEFMWGAGATSTGEDYLYINDVATQTNEWRSTHLDGPFIGPVYGDLDGDGIKEMVVASWESDSGYSSGRILVFDGTNLSLRAMSAPIVGDLAWEGTHDLKLRDVDGDGQQEILVAADRLYDGVIEIYDFSATNQFTLSWSNATQPDGAPFYTVDAADVDGDGQMEIIGGGGRSHTGALGVFFYVYDWTTAAEEWHSFQIGDYWDSITGLSVEDIDSDGIREIAGLSSGTGDVYIFEGQSKAVEAILPGSYQSLSPIALGTGDALVLSDGNLVSVIQDQGPGNTEIFSQNFGLDPISGVSAGPNNWVFVGAAGRLGVYTTTGTELFLSESYGSVFGNSAIIMPNLGTLITSGSYSVNSFVQN